MESNPLDLKSSKSTKQPTATNVISLAGALPIVRSEYDKLIDLLKACSDNEQRLTTLEQTMISYLFSSAQLITLMELTPSIKTRLSMISLVGPRLTDPKAKSEQLIGMFRYSEEKQRVTEVLKARTTVLASSLFKPSGLSSAIGMTAASSAAEDLSRSGVNKPVVALSGIVGFAGARQKTEAKRRVSLLDSSSDGRDGGGTTKTAAAATAAVSLTSSSSSTDAVGNTGARASSYSNGNSKGNGSSLTKVASTTTATTNSVSSSSSSNRNNSKRSSSVNRVNGQHITTASSSAGVPLSAYSFVSTLGQHIFHILPLSTP